MTELGEKRGWRHAPGWMKLLLIASLSVNVAVVGMVAGNAMRSPGEGLLGNKQPNEPGLDRRESRILRYVPDTRRDEAREIILARQAEYQAAREAMRSAQTALVEAIRAETLDVERLSEALNQRRAASGKVWGIGYEQMAEIARRLNYDERMEMAARLEERTRRWLARQEKRGN
jgi:uncharacterized membrane protein